jgi:hypothetical protein
MKIFMFLNSENGDVNMGQFLEKIKFYKVFSNPILRFKLV